MNSDYSNELLARQRMEDLRREAGQRRMVRALVAARRAERLAAGTRLSLRLLGRSAPEPEAAEAPSPASL